jgi:hypothetical protein
VLSLHCLEQLIQGKVQKTADCLSHGHCELGHHFAGLDDEDSVEAVLQLGVQGHLQSLVVESCEGDEGALVTLLEEGVCDSGVVVAEEEQRFVDHFQELSAAEQPIERKTLNFFVKKIVDLVQFRP